MKTAQDSRQQKHQHKKTKLVERILTKNERGRSEMERTGTDSRRQS